MSDQELIRVLIADDHPVVREGIAAMLRLGPEIRVIAEASTTEEAIASALLHRPDIVLMDLRMPEIGGVEAIKRLREAWPEVRVILLTTYDHDEDIYRALLAGAKSYLLKDIPRQELLDGVRAVHAGKKYIHPDVAAKLAEQIGAEHLSEREIDVLQLIAAGKSNKEIGSQLSITEGTVKVHISNLMSKLGVNDRTQAVIEGLRKGLIYID